MSSTGNWDLAVVVLATAAATVVGYVVSFFVPPAHFPRSFGVLAADAIMAGLAFIGVKPVADVLFPFILISVGAVGLFFAWRDRGIY